MSNIDKDSMTIVHSYIDSIVFREKYQYVLNDLRCEQVDHIGLIRESLAGFKRTYIPYTEEERLIYDRENVGTLFNDGGFYRVGWKAITYLFHMKFHDNNACYWREPNHGCYCNLSTYFVRPARDIHTLLEC